jgi:hypothetical protein
MFKSIKGTAGGRRYCSSFYLLFLLITIFKTSKTQYVCSYYPVDLATAATTMAAEAAQHVTTPQRIADLGQQKINGRKPSPVSTDVVEAKGNDPDSIFHLHFCFWIVGF